MDTLEKFMERDFEFQLADCRRRGKAEAELGLDVLTGPTYVATMSQAARVRAFVVHRARRDNYYRRSAGLRAVACPDGSPRLELAFARPGV